MTPPRIVGCIHLPPLPGSALGGSVREFAALLDHVRQDALAWAAGGADALIVENFGDVPFLKDAVPPHTVVALTRAVLAVQETSGLPVGVNVLRNDVLSAVSIAALTGASFVRANVYVGAALTDQGIIEGRAAEVQELIRRLGADVAIWADVDIKHAVQIAPRPLDELAHDAVDRGLAAALIVTGSGTGRPTALADLETVRAASPDTPLYVGSGVAAENAAELLSVATGAIVGTAAKRDGIVTNPVDPMRVKAIVTAASQSR